MRCQPKSPCAAARPASTSPYNRNRARRPGCPVRAQCLAPLPAAPPRQTPALPPVASAPACRFTGATARPFARLEHMLLEMRLAALTRKIEPAMREILALPRTHTHAPAEKKKRPYGNENLLGHLN